jgi:hypothetical protein
MAGDNAVTADAKASTTDAANRFMSKLSSLRLEHFGRAQKCRHEAGIVR